MSEKYKIKEVQILLQSGVSLIADIDSIDGLESILKDLSANGFYLEDKKKSLLPPLKQEAKFQPGIDEAGSRVETKASLPQGALTKAKIIAFKDKIPQLLRPNIFSNVTEAMLVLLFSVESGLQTSKVNYDSFKGLFEAQNIKSGSPMRMLLTNLRNSGYLNKKAYSEDKSLSLTAKGESKAIEVLKSLCE